VRTFLQSTHPIASIIGSGINGNARSTAVFSAQATQSLLLLEVELMETLVPLVQVQARDQYRFYYWKWN